MPSAYRLTALVVSVINAVEQLAFLIQEFTLNQSPEIESASRTGLRAADIYTGLIVGRITFGLLGLELRVSSHLTLFRQRGRLVHQERMSVSGHTQN